MNTSDTVSAPTSTGPNLAIGEESLLHIVSALNGAGHPAATPHDAGHTVHAPTTPYTLAPRLATPNTQSPRQTEWDTHPSFRTTPRTLSPRCMAHCTFSLHLPNRPPWMTIQSPHRSPHPRDRMRDTQPTIGSQHWATAEQHFGATALYEASNNPRVPVACPQAPARTPLFVRIHTSRGVPFKSESPTDFAIVLICKDHRDVISST
jgi:hypothetical protein